jgi:hypothetical protein
MGSTAAHACSSAVAGVRARPGHAVADLPAGSVGERRLRALTSGHTLGSWRAARCTGSSALWHCFWPSLRQLERAPSRSRLTRRPPRFPIAQGQASGTPWASLRWTAPDTRWEIAQVSPREPAAWTPAMRVEPSTSTAPFPKDCAARPACTSEMATTRPTCRMLMDSLSASSGAPATTSSTPPAQGWVRYPSGWRALRRFANRWSGRAPRRHLDRFCRGAPVTTAFMVAPTMRC